MKRTTDQITDEDLNKLPLHEALRVLRRKYVGTQSEMAKAMGMSPNSTHISLVEKGKSKLSADKLELWLSLCFHKIHLERMTPTETREKLMSYKPISTKK